MKSVKWSVLILFCPLCLFALSASAQDKNVVDSLISYYVDASHLFEQGKYMASIAEANKGIRIYNNEKTSMYSRLLLNNALCYNYLGDNDKAVEMAGEAYLHCGTGYSFFTDICYFYMQLSFFCPSPLFNDEILKDCAIRLLNSEPPDLCDYSIGCYTRMLEKKLSKLNNEEIDVELSKEKSKFFQDSSFGKTLLSPLFKYMEARLSYLKDSGYAVYVREDTPREYAEKVRLLNEALNELGNIQTIYAKKLTIYVCFQLAELYSSMGYSHAAEVLLEQVQEIYNMYEVELFKTNCFWEYTTTSSLAYSEKFVEYVNEHYECLRENISFCKERVYNFDFVSSLRMNSDDYIDDFTVNVDSIANRIVSWGGMDSLVDSLSRTEHSYLDVIKICNKVQQKMRDEEFYEGYLLSNKDVEDRKCTRYDIEIDTERERCHYGNSFDLSFIGLYYCTSLAYMRNKDYENAIRYIKRAIDVVRTDWKFNPNERKELLSFPLQDSWRYYLPRELEMNHELSNMYVLAGQYENAYESYRYTMDLSLDILRVILRFGSNEDKLNKFEKYNGIYYSIIDELADLTQYNPKFADLILEASAMIKGFMLNYIVQSDKCAKQKSPELAEMLNLKSQTERTLEHSNYEEVSDADAAALEQANLDVQIYSELEPMDLFSKNLFTTEKVKSLMKSNDVVVDFFTKNTGEYFSSADSILQNRQDYGLYACVLRNEYESPKVVFLGRISEANTENGNLLEYLEHWKNDPGKINELYTSDKMRDFIWGKILSAGEVVKGDTVLSVPSGPINRVAIENFQGIDSLFIKRLSSLSEINKDERLYGKDDKCVAFTGAEFNSKSSGAGGNLNSNPQAILKRRLLTKLSDEFSVDSLSIVNLKGKCANECEFEKMSGNSPEIMVFYTHGYNYENIVLSDADSTYLLGKNRVSEMTSGNMGMFTSGLFLSESGCSNVMTDGMLTAHEVSMCDLSKTSIVVLAACSTAIGQISPEGVYGLQRGFKLAGAAFILASLWDVDSKATHMFVETFLKHYKNGNTKQDALRKTQEDIKIHESQDVFVVESWQNPYYWAGFILID